MSRWWRAYDEAVDDPKLCLLTDKQHRAWFNLCCITSQNGGKLPAMAAVAFKLRLTVDKAKSLVAELITLGLVDLDPETAVAAPHNWRSRQFQSDVSTERVKRFRNGGRNVSETANETPPETEQKQSTETDSEPEPEAEKKERRARSAALWPFDEFWLQYPHKVGKQAAEKAFRKAEKSATTTISNLMLGLMRYAAKTDDRPWCNPATWLNEGRWEDQPAPQLFNGNGARNGQPSAGDRAREFAELARQGEAQGGFGRPIEPFGSS